MDVSHGTGLAGTGVPLRLAMSHKHQAHTFTITTSAPPAIPSPNSQLVFPPHVPTIHNILDMDTIVLSFCKLTWSLISHPSMSQLRGPFSRAVSTLSVCLASQSSIALVSCIDRNISFCILPRHVLVGSPREKLSSFFHYIAPCVNVSSQKLVVPHPHL